jgi:hypothetical protein
MNDKPKEIIFGEGCFDSIADEFETQEELDAFVNELKHQLQNMSEDDFEACEPIEPFDVEPNPRH